MRRRKLRMSFEALNDLLAAHDYIATFDPIAARRFLDDINGKIEWMARLGISGSPRDFIPRLRGFPYRKRCIYFFIDDHELTVLRILHGRQKITPDNSFLLPEQQED